MVVTPLMRLLLSAAALAALSLAVMTGFERHSGSVALGERAAERRALLHRHLELDRGAMAPGSALACLSGVAGDTVEQACEKAIFASAPAAAAAVSYTGLRLSLLAEAVAFAGEGEAEFLNTFAGSRRAIELDRFGLAAHVLAVRDGCTAERCAGFALVRDSGVLKANLRNRVFDQYVSRHADGWSAPAREAEPQVSQSRDAAPPAMALAEPPAIARAATGQNNVPRTVIPPVSIMDSEPQLAAATGDAAAAGATAAPAATGTPLPPRRPAPAVRPPE